MFSYLLKCFCWLLIASSSLLAADLVTPRASHSSALEQVGERLQVVAVFVVVDQAGNYYQVQEGDVVIIPLYLDRASAEKQAGKLASGTAFVRPYSLDIFYKKAATMKEALKAEGKRLETPLVVLNADLSKAYSILESEGSSQDVKDGLRVPVFFTEPMITANTPRGIKRLFFFNYGQLEEALGEVDIKKRRGLKVRVADMQVVLDLMASPAGGDFVFMATRDYLDLRLKYLEGKNK